MASDTGIVRRVDDLGRIVLPAELRRTLGIKVKDPIHILVDGEQIILKKHVEGCRICGSPDKLVEVGDNNICTGCVEEIKGLT